MIYMKHVLVTGATGYIGGRLIPRLLDQGHRVRVLVRDASRIEGRLWADKVEVCTGDLLNQETLGAAMKGIDAAYYLVHSMHAEGNFADLDEQAADNFIAAGRELKLVVYLGGLLPRDKPASKHLDSRAQVGRQLRTNLPTTEFRAGPIIGSGSASFEMVRYLTDRLPAMCAPKWIMNEVQPIGIAAMLDYLIAALDEPALGVVEVGTEPRTFKAMMQEYAAVRGYRRFIFPVPVLAPTLAALWVGLVTPIPNRLAVPLVQGVIAPLYADRRKAREHFPDIIPLEYTAAVSRAISRVNAGEVETRWSDALGQAGTCEVSDWEGVIREVRTLQVDALPEKVFGVVTSLGGEKGWLVWNWAWRLRGFLDQIVGGPGLRRGRRHSHQLLPGEAVDFWRVEKIEAPNRLLLRAEMKVPGRAWLQYECHDSDGGTRLVQTALFEPDGFFGILYWKLLYPIHKLIFSDMVKSVGAEAETC